MNKLKNFYTLAYLTLYKHFCNNTQAKYISSKSRRITGMPNSGFQRHCVAELNGYYYIIGRFEIQIEILSHPFLYPGFRRTLDRPISWPSNFKNTLLMIFKLKKGGSSPANKIYRLDIANNVIKKLTTQLPHDFYMHRNVFY